MRPTPTTSERSRLANLTSKYGPNDPRTCEARREYRRARAEHLIRQIVDDAPELTASDREHLAALLLPPSDATAGAA